MIRAICFLGLLLLFVLLLVNRPDINNKERVTLKSHCVKTELYFYRSSGGITNIYDCSKNDSNELKNMLKDMR